LVTGDFKGRITSWDTETLNPVVSFVGHEQIINAMDGCGGQSFGCGPPELVSASRDGIYIHSDLGTVKIWDLRQGNNPAAVIAPTEGSPLIDPWAVSFGNYIILIDRKFF
jgi:WD40 repeat protein